MSDVETRILPLLPLATGVVLPLMVIPLSLESDEAKAAADAAVDGMLILVPRREITSGETGETGETGNTTMTYARVGTVAKIEEAGRLPGGGRAVLVRGLQRAVVGTGVPGAGRALWVEVEVVDEEPGTEGEELETLVREYRVVAEAILEHRNAPWLAEALRGITDPSVLADSAGYSPDLPFDRKVELLETVDVTERLAKALGWAKETLAELEMKQRIRTDVTSGMEKRQREFLLRQQMDAIRKELGEDGDDLAGEYRARLEDLPEAVREAAEREVDRLERTSEQSPEHSWIRTWLDRLFELPWGKRSDDRLELDEARAILDADHTGLDDVKQRIVEQLAVRKLRRERGLDDRPGEPANTEPSSSQRRGTGAILALVGPPGVGKTSLGESVARALGRQFVRVALGGVRDEAEIRGHRRTYVGALPGRIVRAIKEAGVMNPVLMLDEVDKLGADWRGDPTSALLEVLDPAQNHTFRDHYLELDLDLSDVLFLATANVLDTIPGPLLDRMEVIRLDGYTEDEKLAIARDHLLPRQRERHGLVPGEVEVTDAALRAVVTGWTREAGVRNLERELGRVLRKAVTRIASGDTSVGVDEGTLPDFLGRRRFFDEAADRTGVAGVATGLAVTGMGGDVLFVEASYSDGHDGGGSLQVTGQLGDVMKESSEIALSYVRSHADALGLPERSFGRRRFHVHVPAGAVPKDGPSAGVTMTTALVSLLTGRRVRSEVGMTGEVTLSGRVLPIGGVKQKVLAAHRAGLTEVVLPERNGPDLDDVPEAVREAMTFHLVSDVTEVLRIALEEEVPAQAPAA
ncbi:MAG: endopeptidase La [Acidimicrobiia bacterium]